MVKAKTTKPTTTAAAVAGGSSPKPSDKAWTASLATTSLCPRGRLDI